LVPATLSSMAKDWKTKLLHTDARVPEGFRSLSSPTYRGSTVLFDDVANLDDRWNQYDGGYTYGLYGTPTVLELASRICELENGFRTIITPGGQAAITLIHLALLKAGDHILIPESIYSPNRWFASRILRGFGVETTFYTPTIGEGITQLLRANTRAVWCESPGSITMEVQDIPAIAKAAHAASVPVVLDNTWAAGVLFDAFSHGVDITMQAVTKYIGGHSDLLLGSVTVRDQELYKKLGSAQQLLGISASPDDCSLALRGMKTMAVRLKTIEASALDLARWFTLRSEIERVLHPALETCAGHEFWKRDFTGSAGVFSIVFRDSFSKAQVQNFVNRLELFKIGYSWGGVTSLAAAYDFRGASGRGNYAHRIVRLNIGLEDVEDLRSDLSRGLDSLVR